MSWPGTNSAGHESRRSGANGADRDGQPGAPAATESGSKHNALWWARVQSAGPLLVSPDTPAVAGLTRAAEPDGRGVWLLPALPDGAGPAVLDELGTSPVPVEQPNETARVLAICLTCCWSDRSGPAWPGVPASLAQVRAVYAGFRGRAEQSTDLTLIVGSLRRLHATSWLIWDETAGDVRLGPRVVGWGPGQLSGLREVCRILPDPPRPALPASRTAAHPTAPMYSPTGTGAEPEAAEPTTGPIPGPIPGPIERPVVGSATTRAVVGEAAGPVLGENDRPSGTAAYGPDRGGEVDG